MILRRQTKGARLRGRWYEVDGCQLYVREGGEEATATRPALVMVHGFVICSSYMAPLAERLALSLPVFAPDLPGFGKSEAPRQPLDVPGLADALVAWLARAKLDRADWLANSLGCQVVADLAARYPAQVRRLVLVGPSTDPAARTPAQQLLRLLRDAPREKPSLLLMQGRAYVRAGLRQVVGTSGHALADRIEDKLPHVRAPTLVVRGALDPVTPQRWAEQVTQLLPDGRLVVLPGVGHAANYSAPDALTAVVRPFLSD